MERLTVIWIQSSEIGDKIGLSELLNDLLEPLLLTGRREKDKRCLQRPVERVIFTWDAGYRRWTHCTFAFETDYRSRWSDKVFSPLKGKPHILTFFLRWRSSVCDEIKCFWLPFRKKKKKNRQMTAREPTWPCCAISSDLCSFISYWSASSEMSSALLVAFEEATVERTQNHFSSWNMRVKKEFNHEVVNWRKTAAEVRLDWHWSLIYYAFYQASSSVTNGNKHSLQAFRTMKNETHH